MNRALFLSSIVLLAGCLGSSTPPPPLTAGSILPRLPEGLVVHRNSSLLPDVGFEPLRNLSLSTFLVGERGGEPNIGVTSSGALFVTAFDHTMKSTDGGKTWTSVYEFGRGTELPLNNRKLVSTSDPYLWVDPDTDRIFVPHMFPILLCAQAIWSDDEGQTWNEKPLSCGLPLVDHQKLSTGPFGPEAPPIPHTYKNAVYFCYNKLVSTNCAVSFDGGQNFLFDQPVALQPKDGCGGINGSPATARDGTVYVPIVTGCDGPYIAVSTTNGMSWTLKKGPTSKGAFGIDADITVTPNGTLYMVYQGSDQKLYMIRSKDRGDHFEGPFLVSPPTLNATVFSVITSGDDGRIAAAYLGTTTAVRDPSQAPNETRWYLYVTVSLDAESPQPTFVTKQVSPPDDPVQIGCVWLEGGSNACRNLLDFIDMVSDKQGRFYVAYTDGCTKDCAGNPKATANQSRSRDVAVAVLESGPSLLLSQGILTPLHPSP